MMLGTGWEEELIWPVDCCWGLEASFEVLVVEVVDPGVAGWDF